MLENTTIAVDVIAIAAALLGAALWLVWGLVIVAVALTIRATIKALPANLRVVAVPTADRHH